MYSIGAYTKPTEENGYDCWTLDIDFHCTDGSRRSDHGAVVQVCGDTLSQCLLKAKFICICLNSEGMNMAEVFIKLLDVSKINPVL